ncbi:excinuclease ABC subunit UvrC [Schaalia suimastitidis]|uniref:excinuclease ABC subunit UvrC n=1 Tax=Schaalia suimastitidis TaxID=121163 RepID=UPI000419E2E4|nr:excinuclease ABC subunit UvrC [Schaalia suimastitidis]
MADPSTYRPRTSDIPTNPGVYRFRDDQGRVIYVGKAKNLRARLVNYFQDLSALHPRTQQMVTTASSVQWTVVASEVEALTLEFTWIKEFAPRFNVIYKDDKSYPYLSVSLNERFPRVKVTREAKKKGERYFGPYTQVWAIRESIDLLLRVYPVRTCSPGVFSRAKAQGRPCLLADIGKCSAPCVGRISEDDHRSLAVDLCRFMDGRTGPVIRDLEEKMRHASANLEFEQAGAYRDDIAALKTVLERNTMVLDDGTDADIFALAVDDLDAAVHVFHVRGGRVRGTRSWVISRIDDASEEQLMARLLEQVYGELPVMQLRRSPEKSARTSIDDVEHTPTRALPREVLVSVLPEDSATVVQWLTQRRGAKVMLRVPERGPKAALMETVMTNARQALALHKTKRAGDLTERSRALEVLCTELGLDHAPLRIECFDVSHTAGTHRVASMVVFEDGIPRKDAYRSFIIRGDASQNADDTAAMQEVLIRRFSRLAAEIRGEDGIDDDGVALESGPIDPSSGKARRFSYKPDLVLVDGGPPQVASACAALEQVGITLPVVGLAKRLEELWLPGQAYPVILPRTSPGLYLLQHLRDESHRFAISAHRKKRSKAQTRSILDDIAGLGAARQAALLKAFGSVKRLREADVDEIAKVVGIGPRLAQTIVDGLRQGTMESSST